jgi:integrase/recombinase XerD
MVITKRKKYPGIRKRSENTYELNFYVGDKRVTRNVRANSEGEANRIRIQLIADSMKDSAKAARRIETKRFSLNEAFQYYLTNTAKLLHENTRQRSECVYNHLKKFLSEYHPDVQFIDEITSSLGTRYKEYLLSQTNRRPSGINTDIFKLRAIFRKFCEYEFIEENPFTKVERIPRRLARPLKKHLPSDDEIRILLNNINQEDYLCLTKFLIRVGRRIEETSLYLKSDVINDNGKLIALKVREEITKTKEAGEIPFDDELSGIVLAALKKNPDSSFLFTNPFGRKISQNSYREFLKEICLVMNITIITPHCFRYFAVNKMVEAGVNVRDAMAITGHVDLGSFMSYLKSTEQGRQKALSSTRLDRILSGTE